MAAVRFAFFAGVALAAGIGSKFMKRTVKYSLEAYLKTLKEGFLDGFTMEAIQKQWELDRFRLELFHFRESRWILSKHLPRTVPNELSKIIMASATQVGPAVVFENIVANNPESIITHPAHDYPLRIWLKNNQFKYEMYFRALNPDTLEKGKLIKGLLVIDWQGKEITTISVSEQRVLFADN